MGGFVAGEVAEAGGLLVELGPGLGVAGGLVFGFGLFDLRFEEDRFVGEGAAEAPFGPGHLFDAEVFGFVLGLEPLVNRFVDGVEAILILVG